MELFAACSGNGLRVVRKRFLISIRLTNSENKNYKSALNLSLPNSLSINLNWFLILLNVNTKFEISRSTYT